MKKLQEGWNEVPGTTISIYVADGKVIRGTAGEGANYHAIYPYRYSVSENAYENISGISVRSYKSLDVKNGVIWK